MAKRLGSLQQRLSKMKRIAIRKQLLSSEFQTVMCELSLSIETLIREGCCR
ncbi:MAG: hypothetical protein IT223_05715 [Crocinitomicaceae bacterium]|nr:hypothetical protein [Crocinitomicaceae bacterium]